MLIDVPRSQDWLTRCYLDAIIATSWPNVLYLTGYYLWIQPVFKEYMTIPGGGSDLSPLYGVLSSQGQRALVLDQMCEVNATHCSAVQRFVCGATNSNPEAEEAGSAPTSPPFEQTPHRFDTPLRALTAALHSLNLSSSRIGVDFEAFPPPRLVALREAMPQAKFVDASNLFRMLRMVKSDEEQRRLRRAAEISQRAAEECLNAAKPGDSMLEIAQKYRASVAAAGAEFEHFAYTQRGVGISTEVDYRLPRRETMFVDFGCIYRHYYSDAGVTLAAGKLLDREQSAYDRLVETLARGAELLRPGATPSSVQAAMQRCLEDDGFHGHFPHGHGLGIEIRDYPILVPDNGKRIRDDCIDLPADVPLEAGMVINLEAPIFGLQGAGLQLEQTYLVTARGGEPLVQRDLTRPIIVG